MNSRDPLILIGLGLVIASLCGMWTLWVSRNGGVYGIEYIVGGAPTLMGVFMVVISLFGLLRNRLDR